MESNDLSNNHPASPSSAHRLSPHVHVLSLQEKTIIVVGTAHVSQKSADLVHTVIEAERPDAVCLELDQRRFDALAERHKWESLDLKEILRRKQLSTLLANVVLASYQKRLGDQIGVLPGTEMLEARKTAHHYHIPIVLCDRDIRITMQRAWRSTPFLKKNVLVASLILSIFDTTPISEESLLNLTNQDILSAIMQDLETQVPTLKSALIDERDAYLAEKILKAQGRKVVAVVGAGHVEGLIAILQQRHLVDIEQLEQIPPASPVWKWIGWSIPVLIISAIGLIGYQQGLAAAGENAWFWVVANGIPSGVGAVLAFAHPLTILVAIVGAPLTSLTPVIGVGYLTAFVQTYVLPPTVREFQTVADDIAVPRKWWENRLLRIFLAFLLPTIGSILGTWIGGTRIVANLF